MSQNGDAIKLETATVEDCRRALVPIDGLRQQPTVLVAASPEQ